MSEEEDSFERKTEGLSLTGPLILAAMMGVGMILAIIGAIWLMVR